MLDFVVSIVSVPLFDFCVVSFNIDLLLFRKASEPLSDVVTV